eukprot:TRINITY_DN840_c0_g4_i2.p2 TRINITY_DN840_c0_g4~~TRINITY_DN840_c0_g4_i2.p2  ORF type:complete len:612 (+),score=234.83 TRINITY_DN840_c0_g4_i2:61-1896(+)
MGTKGSKAGGDASAAGADTGVLNIYGYEGCSFHMRAMARANDVASQSGGRLSVETQTWPRPEFKEWVAGESQKHDVKHGSSPFVTLNGKYLGGCDDTLAWLDSAVAEWKAGAKLIDDDEPETHNYDYDMIVVGGGSGGMALSKAAATLLTPNGDVDPKVCCLDFVKPSPPGSTWGFGGTCVNVGCIPKKLFHTAAITRDTIMHAPKYGAPEEVTKAGETVWETVRGNIQQHIKKLNFGAVAEVRSGNVKYKNALGELKDAHTVECTNKKGKKETITARRIVLAMGGRPAYPDIPGAREYGVTSDDIFSLEKAPGKTVVVGASYIALECAGFLTGLGYDTTVLMRSIPLRGFDQEMANIITDFMEAEGTHFKKGVTPTEVKKDEAGKLHVVLSNGESIECDTVLFAMGRVPDAKINLEAAGVKTHPKSGKIVVDSVERTSTPNIYAIGDIIHEGLELTPVAIQTGRLLAKRLYGGGSQLMSQEMVPTTVFTPLEYGCVGPSEEDAIKQYGESNIEIYHTKFTPLEWTVADKPANVCYLKLITSKKENEKVIAFHILSPNAGEILQGVSVAIRAGATKAHFDDTVGIHPTIAELFTDLKVTKSSGVSADQGGC